MKKADRDPIIAQCVGLLCAAKGKEFDEAMADAWTVALHDEPELRPHLRQATADAVKAHKWVTLHDVVEIAQDYAKTARRAANRSVAPKKALPAATPEQMRKHRDRLRALLEGVRAKFDMNVAGSVPDPEQESRVREQVERAKMEAASGHR